MSHSTRGLLLLRSLAKSFGSSRRGGTIDSALGKCLITSNSRYSRCNQANIFGSLTAVRHIQGGLCLSARDPGDSSGGISDSEYHPSSDPAFDVPYAFPEEGGETVADVDQVPPDELFEQHSLTDDELDSLIALKDFEGIPGLPPLHELMQYDPEEEKRTQRRQMELQKQELQRLQRKPLIDDLGRAYATGRRKTSIARVWLKEGDGRVLVNGKLHDLYFPDVHQRAHFLQPFIVTNTLGRFSVKSTVEGGGISGQAGAVRHGISRALQLYDPELRPALKAAGFLTRDPRMVERKKPGKAKARKSFQWVKR